MSRFIVHPSDGPRWVIINQSAYTDDEVLPLLQFVADRTGGLTEGVTVKLRKPRGSGYDRNHFCGQAGSIRVGHGRYGWQETPLRMGLTLSPRDWSGYRRRARVCWHSSRLSELHHDLWQNRPPGATSSTTLVYEHLERLLDAGETKLGRWPIFHVADWQEMFVHLAGHEVAHLIQYDRGRGAGGSEIFCETFALDLLNAFRAERPCGDEPAPAAEAPPGSRLLGEVSPAQTPPGSLGLVTGPAPAASTNQPEGAIMATSAPTASDEAKSDPKPGKKTTAAAVPAKPKAAAAPAKPKTAVADPKGLFESLLASVKEAVDVKTATTKKQEYVRLDAVLGGKNKTLAYIHHPTKKGVRSLTPNAKGGYDTATVAKESDIPKAVKAVVSRLERVQAKA